MKLGKIVDFDLYKNVKAPVNELIYDKKLMLALDGHIIFGATLQPQDIEMIIRLRYAIDFDFKYSGDD